MLGWADERIYVANLPTNMREKDVEDLFYKYGRICKIELKNGHCLVPFALVRFEDPRDAEDAIYGRNSYDYGQCPLRVENGPSARRSDFRVLVSGLPQAAGRT
uniref:RRM domain-containing protein n=1 Tax=Gorilla gorilla gorilla TaxID=9595 RepID=A0A2I2Y614_GORGO